MSPVSTSRETRVECLRALPAGSCAGRRTVLRRAPQPCERGPVVRSASTGGSEAVHAAGSRVTRRAVPGTVRRASYRERKTETTFPITVA